MGKLRASQPLQQHLAAMERGPIERAVAEAAQILPDRDGAFRKLALPAKALQRGLLSWRTSELW